MKINTKTSIFYETITFLISIIPSALDIRNYIKRKAIHTYVYLKRSEFSTCGHVT
jgi:hypothetical protein